METLLLPGMDGTGKLFTSFERQLSPELHPRIISYPPDRVLGYQQLLGEIRVSPGPFAIVAESFSGPLAIELASRYANRLCALVLVASFVRNPSTLAGWLSFLLRP